MSQIKISEEEKSKIRGLHKTAIDNFFHKKEETKAGLKQPKKLKEDPKEKSK